MYHPPQKIIDRYAHVLVNFALGGGKGIKRGDVVYLVVDEVAKPLYVALRNTILRAGGHVIGSYRPSVDDKHNPERDFFLIAENHQLEFFPATYMKGLVDTIDHSVFILSETDMQALKGVDPKKMMARGLAHKPYMEWRTEKENRGKFTWTLALYGTPAIAKEAGLTEKEYWNQIIKACFLNEKDPVAKWRSVYKKLDIYRKKLDRMPIEKVHVKGPDADLWIKLGEKKKWMGGSGRNIPSFELFTSPEWRGTEGWIAFNQPLYRYGNLITGIRLEFKNGKVVKATAKKNESVLKHMIATANADKVGEFSMTDRRFSRITKFMANTLFDENIGGPEGNSHIALGNAYHDCYAGDPSKVSKKEWERLGFNNSSVHTDIISTAPRTITAYLRNGKQVVIYKNGEYQF
jgi:aminopeptidase